MILMIFPLFLIGFWTLLKPRSRYFGVPFSKKRLAWIRTHARLQPSFYGHEAVAITTPPRPRLRVKGVHIEIMWNRTINNLNVKFTFRVLNENFTFRFLNESFTFSSRRQYFLTYAARLLQSVNRFLTRSFRI